MELQSPLHKTPLSSRTNVSKYDNNWRKSRQRYGHHRIYPIASKNESSGYLKRRLWLSRWIVAHPSGECEEPIRSLHNWAVLAIRESPQMRSAQSREYVKSDPKRCQVCVINPLNSLHLELMPARGRTIGYSVDARKHCGGRHCLSSRILVRARLHRAGEREETKDSTRKILCILRLPP